MKKISSSDSIATSRTWPYLVHINSLYIALAGALVRILQSRANYFFILYD